MTPRRVLRQADAAELRGQLAVIVRPALVNEFKVGYNRPETAPMAFGPAGYDPTGVSLSGAFASSSIDARGTTGIARSGLLIRATSAVVDQRLDVRPASLSFSNAIDDGRAARTR